MTCIIGLVDNGKIYMGGDSSATAGWVQINTVQKVWRSGNLLIGSSGTLRDLQLVQYHLQFMTPPEDISDLQYLVVHVAESIRELLKDHGSADVDNNKETAQSGFLVGYRGNLYRIDSAYAVIPVEDMWAIGNGAEFAMGSMATNFKDEPFDRIIYALHVAQDYCMGVSAPFYVNTL